MDEQVLHFGHGQVDHDQSEVALLLLSVGLRVANAPDVLQ